MATRPPGPQGWDILRTALGFQRDQLGTLCQLTRRYGDVIRYRYGPFPVVLVNHPTGVARVLQDHHTNYNKQGSPFYKMLQWFLGQGLITSDGAYWRRQRRLAQPSFSRKRLEAMGPMMVRCTQEMVAGWRSGQVVDVAQEMMALTLRIIGLAIFSQDISQERGSVGHAFEELQNQMGKRFQAWLPLPPVFPTARDRRFRVSRARLEEIVLAQVRQRRAQSEKPEDLLSTLLEARDPESGESMDDDQIKDELLTFLLAGHETTANLMAWALGLLSRHPEQRQRLQHEVEQLAGRLPEVADLPAMPLGQRILQETLRLYPPAWVFGRRSLASDEIMGYRIGPGTLISISPYMLHRHPEFWPNPEGFDPDRFLEEHPKGSFVPFAAGPRQCIGNYFATLEARLILATLVQSVRLDLMPGVCLEPEALITLRPRHGLPMRVRRC